MEAEPTAVGELVAPIQARGGDAYLGEAVTQRDHALQAAALAAGAEASPALVVAALLHDVGWLLGAGDGDHAERSAEYLARWLPPAATEPVRLHVDAKRWLCTTTRAYYDLLSDASKQTLALQGGLMSNAERVAFEAAPWSSDAVRLRRWDDEAKVPGRVVPELTHWLPMVAALVESG
jgi:gamma-butyrobetaine dioxygenase